MQGVKEIRDFLKQFPDEVKSTVLAPMVKAGGGVLLGFARAFAPQDEGDLLLSLDQVVRQKPKAGTAVSVIGPRRDYIRDGKRPANTAHLPEYGFVARNGRFVPPKPYMRPAMQVGAAPAAVAMAGAATVGVERARRKLVKQYGHAA